MARFTKARVVASAGVLVGGMWGSSLAVFTGQASSAGSFTSGNVDIAASPSSPTSLNVTDMAPGDVATAPITVTNSGSLDLRYALSSAATGALAPALTGTVKTGVTDCSTTGFGSSGTVVAPATALGSLAVGDPAAGAQAGDRTLAPGASEVLCVQVALPVATGDTYESTSASLTLTFSAEQTRNN